MKVIVCSFKGCLSFIETTEPVASVVKYTCRQHVGKNTAKEPHFQDSQFDPRVGAGTDPKAYEAARGLSGKKTDRSDDLPHSSNIPRTFIEKVIKKAAPELDTHENRDEIMAVLTEEVRDHNDGVPKSKEIEYTGPEVDETDE